MKKNKLLAMLLIGILLMGSTSSAFAADDGIKHTVSEPNSQGIIYVYNENGSTLSYSQDSGVTLIEDSGYAFKDLNQNGTLDVYEDWRLDTEIRAANLAELMVADGTEGIEAIAGLMLYSDMQYINSPDLTTVQQQFIEEDNVRHILIYLVQNAEVAVKWSNNLQALVEGLDYGIPANNSSDPRHSVSDSATIYSVGNTGSISMWPNTLGLAATFDPDIVEKHGQVASSEYRALGMTTALSPQIDLATDPRWCRLTGTFGEDTALSTDMARAYIDGFQTTYDENGNDSGWGSGSVNAMVKHWPGGGTGESGRDAHFGFGKFAVYPGDNFSEHLIPFTEGAFNLNGSTESTSAVMPYYTVSYDQDTVNGENVGNSYSRYIIGDLLRTEYQYDGVVCTDWGITDDMSEALSSIDGRCWGVEELSVAERHYKVIMAGCDQFGENTEKEPVLEAYEMMVTEYGQSYADNRFEQSARRLLTNIFNTELFENPYLNLAETESTVGNSEYMEAGYDAQLKSVVMVKNNDNIISENGLEGKKVYIADFQTSGINKGSMSDSNKTFYGNYFGSQMVDNPDEADVAIVVMSSPDIPFIAFANGTYKGTSGYSTEDLEAGGNGYVPISLQYGPYTATTAREQSIADDAEVDGVKNRSYKGKTVSNETNEYILSILEDTKETIGDKPVIVYMKQSNPMIWTEVEPLAEAIVIGYNVQTQAVMDIITGEVEPSGMLPMQQPTNMETVEAQYEDVAHDMECYVDENGYTYDFGFGLCWDGEIGVDTQDDRYDTYVAGHRSDGTSPEVVEVIAKIDAIGEVTLQSKDKINAARDAYNNLPKEQQENVTNIDKLIAAEIKLSDLQIKDVIAKINAIGNVSPGSKDKINSARDAYNALTNEQQEKVTNLSVLVAAEAKYKELEDNNNNLPKLGATFKYGKLTYKITRVPTAKAKGAVQVLSVSANKSLKKTITIPATVPYKEAVYTVESIAQNAFKGNKKATAVVIGNNVKQIQDSAFSGCKRLKKVTIGKSVTKIGKSAFYNSKKLKTVIIKSRKLKTVAKKAFNKIDSKATIKVPKKQLGKYKKMLNKSGLKTSVSIKK